uniref:Uncharacterized protein n=1 Tax=Oryza brachyantha TaxID=4533 RepID=J3MDV8_ORYBR
MAMTCPCFSLSLNTCQRPHSLHATGFAWSGFTVVPGSCGGDDDDYDNNDGSRLEQLAAVDDSYGVGDDYDSCCHAQKFLRRISKLNCVLKFLSRTSQGKASTVDQLTPESLLHQTQLLTLKGKRGKAEYKPPYSTSSTEKRGINDA